MAFVNDKVIYYITLFMAAVGFIAILAVGTSTFNPAGNASPDNIIEFDLTTLPEGEHVRLNIYGRPIYIRHRRPADIEAVRALDGKGIYPERDEDRLLEYEGRKDPRFIVLDGRESKWCVVIANEGDYEEQGGWYCSVRGSHYDGSGRVHRGPDFNLKVPLNARMSSETTVQFFEDPVVQMPF